MWEREGYVNSSSNTQYRYRCMIIKNVNRTRERREREGSPKGIVTRIKWRKISLSLFPLNSEFAEHL